MSDELLEAVAELPKVCEHIEVPIQAGDDGVLQAMKRGYTADDYRRLVGRIRFLPRPMTLSLRNTFRRKARVLLTMLTLVLGGATFMMVISVEASLNNTLDALLHQYGYDVSVWLDRFYRVQRLFSNAVE